MRIALFNLSQRLSILCRNVLVLSVFGAVTGAQAVAVGLVGTGDCSVTMGRYSGSAPSSCAYFRYDGSDLPEQASGFASWLEQTQYPDAGSKFTSATAGYGVRVGYGNIGMTLVADAATDGGNGGTARAEGSALFDDVLTLGSSGLAVGTQVPLEYLFVLDAKLTLETYSSSSEFTRTTAEASFSSSFMFNGKTVGNVGFGRFVDQTPESPIGRYTFTGISYGTIGENVAVRGSMQGFIYADASANFGEFSGARGELVALNSLHLYVRPLVEDVNLISASGHDYSFSAAVVPELSKQAYVVLGLLMFGFRKRVRSIALSTRQFVLRS